ncbi:nitroreductase family protein [Chitinophaga pinensis]|uniref:Nitroreductase n=1 Tax=Chitinophaga pinensis (strain ATCC 43595 / DSM 2588 / LMG 13176 / NBRC 15968 / NCIMB 11800 / UQM 2034) TaxID=485918 RepID=A0A979G3K8_CHIPD|nr:nitroreductase family protein [Chitinophaga pinensis]ACU60159.1 nitroreductase [Chitinophaga pinensis DSM 2588]
MSKIFNLSLIDALQWRYAAKRMTGAVVPEEQLNMILKAAHLAPSGIGLQPYEIIVISNPQLRQQILPIAMNQPQVVESSHLLVFAAWDEYCPERIDRVFDHLTKERGLEPGAADKQRRFAKQYFGQLSLDENFHHAAKQAHIALGLAVAAAALNGIDATPMEGFNATALDDLLQLPAKGLKSSMLLALGYRNEVNDWNLPLKKVRKPFEELVTILR